VACWSGASAGTITVSYESGRVVLTCTAGSSPPPPTGSPLRVNELMTGITGAATDEFIEVVNASDTAFDASGYRVVYRSAAGTSDTLLATLPAGTTIAAHGFYLLGGAGYSGSHAADQSFSVGLASTGGGVGIRDASGALVDSVAYGTATNAFVEGTVAAAPPTAAAPGKSAGRQPDGHDTDNNSADVTVLAAPSPGTTNG